MADKFAELISSAQYCVAIVGEASTGKFSLMDPSLAPIEGFLGVVGIVQGRTRSAFVEELPQPMLDAIRKEFCGRIEAGIVELAKIFLAPAN